MELARQRGPGAERLLAKWEEQAERIESDILQAEQQVKHWCDSRSRLDKEKEQLLLEKKALERQQAHMAGGVTSPLEAFKDVLQLLATARLRLLRCLSGTWQAWLSNCCLELLLLRPHPSQQWTMEQVWAPSWSLSRAHHSAAEAANPPSHGQCC
eukprot:2245528-Amphidinium_carterae.1